MRSAPEPPASTWPRPPARSLDLPFSPSCVAEARRGLLADMMAAGVQDAVRNDALVVLSELLGNALRHARPLEGNTVKVMWRVSDDEVEVAVADGGSPTAPRADRPPFAALSGRGLGIVDALCESWGVEGVSTPYQLVWGVVGRGTLPRHAREPDGDEPATTDWAAKPRRPG